MYLRGLRLVTCSFLLFISMTAIVIQYSVSKNGSSQLGCVHNLSPLEGATDINRKQQLSGLKVLRPAKYKHQSDVKCVNATVGNISFPMCIYYPKSDIFVSKWLVTGKYYESELVQKMLVFFRKHPDVSFVDIGANLGIYSLPIAHSGIHVVAVEPNKDTVRRLAKSVHLGRIEKNIDILNYALSNKESKSFLQFDARNRGDTFMVDNASCPGCLSTKVTVLNRLIPFIRHKKVLMKIDAQEAEIMIFQRKSAAKFFDEVDVVMIQMEWVLYPKRFGQTEDKRQRVDRFLEFFYQRGYDVYDPRTEQVLDANWTIWTFDVLFKKDDLPKNQLFRI